MLFALQPTLLPLANLFFTASALLLCNPLLAANPTATPTSPTKQSTVTAPALPPANPAAAPAKPGNTNLDLAKKIWVLTNGDKTITHIKSGLGGGESQMSLSIDKNMAEKITAVLNQTFDPAPDLIQHYVAEKANPEQLATIIKWLESFYGKKVREAEVKSQIQYNELESTVPLKEPKFSKEREALYKRYERIALEANTKTISETVEFYHIVNNSTKPPTERIGPKQLEQTLKINQVKIIAIGNDRKTPKIEPPIIEPKNPQMPYLRAVG